MTMPNINTFTITNPMPSQASKGNSLISITILEDMVWGIEAETEQEIIDDLVNTLGEQAKNSRVNKLVSEQGAWPSVDIVFEGTSDELAKRLVEAEYYDEEDAEYFLGYSAK